MSRDVGFLLMLGMMLTFALGMLAWVKWSERADRRPQLPGNPSSS